MAKVIGRLRSWRQRFDPNADFVWRKPTVWDGVEYEAGDLVPEGIRKGKLLYMWNACRIELAMFEQPPGAVPRPEESESVSSQNQPPVRSQAPLPDNVEQRGSWFAVTMPDGSEQRVQGRKALDELLAEIDG